MPEKIAHSGTHSGMTPTLDLARRFFVVALVSFGSDLAIRSGWYRHWPNYIAVSAAIFAVLGSAVLRASRRRSPLGIERDALFGFSAELWCGMGVLVAFLAFYAATGSFDPSPFNAHIRQAFAFLHGHLDIDAPNYIEHAVFKGHSYQLHPPLPAFLLMPMVAIFGMDTNQTAISLAVGAIDVALAWRMLRRFRLANNARVWLTVFFGAGTILWFETINGSSWALSMVVAIAFTLLALDELFGPARPGRVGAFIGLAALARYDLAFDWPVFMALLYLRGRNFREIARILPGLVVTVIVYAIFNEVRYQSIFDRGVFIFAPPGSQLFAWRNFPGNLYTLMFMAPMVNGDFPYIHPTFGGQALILTSPAFVLALRPNYRRPEAALVALAATIAMGPSLFYFTNGFSQFGTRHYLHAFPFLLVLMAMGLHRRVDQLTRILIVASMFLIAYGVWHVQIYGFAA